MRNATDANPGDFEGRHAEYTAESEQNSGVRFIEHNRDRYGDKDKAQHPEHAKRDALQRAR
ncbi:hypothetical protein CLE01_30640 [Cryobacterium levicorallinum]|nr:hypothetical protein CLE01_30640 [Cryobacterium levicorallinum]